MIKHITLGIKETFYFDYNGEQLPLRPISSFELDECFYNALVYADEEIAELVVKFKLGLLKPTDTIDIDNKKYAELKKYFDNIDYWIVYNGMKDFQDEEFSKPEGNIPKGMKDIMKMDKIHKIATKILTYSYQSKEIIQEIVKSEDGKVLANIVFHLNAPLAELGSMTKLQKDFLILSKIKPKKDTIEKTGDVVDLRKILGGLV